MIALQELNLCYRFSPIYWNTACLTVNSGSIDNEGEEVVKSTDYTKMAVALGDIIDNGIKISLVDINESAFDFKPNEKENTIVFGLKGVTGIGDDVVNAIINNRPYSSIEDVVDKVKINKTGIINLIKGGAFDRVYKNKTREEILAYYIHITANEKKRLTLQNFNGLINAKMTPKELESVVNIYKYTKTLKKYAKEGTDYVLSNPELLGFFEEFLDTDLLFIEDGIPKVTQSDYDKEIYQKNMDIARAWLKANQKELLAQYNNLLFSAEWEKYCTGNISHWEMDSISFYYHDHELKNIDSNFYGIVDFQELPRTPEVDYIYSIKGKDIPIYKLSCIVGTVIGSDKTKGIVNLLTINKKVVTVKFRKDFFAMFNKQISEAREDGTKRIVERSWFKRGNKILITGYRRDDQFVPKTYKKTNTHTLYKIEELLPDGKMILRSER